MKSIRLAMCVALASMLSGTSVAQAAPPNPVLEVVPDNAWGMVLVRNLAEVDKKLMGFSQAINSPMAGMSPLMMAKGMLGLFAGVDDRQGLALVVMPMTSPEDFENKFVLLIPTNDYDELLATMQPEEAVEGVSKVTFQGKPSFVAKKGSFAVFGPSADAVQAVVTAKGSVTQQLTPYQLERMGTDDLTVWVNVAAATKSEMVGGLLAMLEGMGAGGTVEQIRSFKSMQVSVRIDPQGINLGFYGNAIAGTPMAAAIEATKAPPGSLLVGLPAEDYVLAIGQVWSAQSAEMGGGYVDQAGEQIGTMLGDEIGAVVGQLLEIFKEMIGRTRSFGMSINALPDGADGMISASLVIGMTGSASDFVKSIGALYQAATAMAGEAGEADSEQAEHVAKIKSLIAFSAQGDNAAMLTLNPAGMGAGEEDLAIMKKILGQEGLVLRFEAVDDKHVAMTFGGGQAHADAVAKLVKSGQAPLTADPGIAKVSASAPKGRISEMYFSVNNFVSVAKRIGDATGNPLPIELANVESPVSLCGYVTPDGGSQADLMVPTELIKAVLQAVMGQMMGAGAAGATSPPM